MRGEQEGEENLTTRGLGAIESGTSVALAPAAELRSLQYYKIVKLVGNI
jgi:hypothetical protein